MDKSDRPFYESPEVSIIELRIEGTILHVSGRDSYDTTDENPFA